MPTPSDNTPQLFTTSLVNDISSHTTCPPEIERLPLRSDSPDPSAIAERDAIVNNAPSPAHTTAHSMLMRSEDAATTDPMRVDSGSGASGSAVMKATTKSEEDSGVGRLSPAGEPSCSVQQPSSVANSPSVASLLSYEFSNVRVCTRVADIPCIWLTDCGSFSLIIHPRFYAPGVNSPGLNSRIARCTMSTSRLNMLTWLNHIFVVISGFKVCIPANFA